MLDISCAGHLVAGDDSITGALRELKEELNLDVKPNDLLFIKTIKRDLNYTETFINREFDDIYILKINKTIGDMKFQESEISEIFFVDYNIFKKMVENKQPDLIMHTEEFRLLFDFIENNN